jgi:hypothetical protein
MNQVHQKEMEEAYKKATEEYYNLHPDSKNIQLKHDPKKMIESIPTTFANPNQLQPQQQQQPAQAIQLQQPELIRPVQPILQPEQQVLIAPRRPIHQQQQAPQPAPVLFQPMQQQVAALQPFQQQLEHLEQQRQLLEQRLQQLQQ